MNIFKALSESGKVATLGMGTVFLGLGGLIIILWIFGKVFGIKPTNSNAADFTPETEPSASKEQNLNNSFFEVEQSDAIDYKLVAVITAAVAAALNRSTHDIVVKSIKHVASHSPVWNRASRQEQISSKL